MDIENIVLSFFDFVSNIDFNIFSVVIGLLFIIFWLVIVGWVWMDSGERTTKRWARVVYILLVLILNIPGLIIYLIIRPNETVEEIYWADLERRYLKYETSELGDCSKCGHQLYPGYVYCTNCGNEIKIKCPRCGVLVDKDHKFCEFCGFQVRDRAVEQEKYPDVQTMEQQIQATKEHATETVESKRTKYKTGDSFVVSLGESIISLFVKAKDGVTPKKDIEEKSVPQNIKVNSNNQKGKKNKNKKKKK